MELLESKILACSTLGIGSIFVGLLPICFTHNNRNQSPLVLSCLLCFGGGVLLSTSLTHMLPENREKLKEYGHFAEIIFCIGFFLLYIIDEIVHFIYGGTHDHSILNKRHSYEVTRRHSSHERHYGATENTALWKGQQPPYNPAFYKTKSDSVLFLEDNAPSQLCHVAHQEPCESSVPTINIGLVIALTLHSLLEGLVVGLESTPSKVLLLLGAICSHKFVVGFCLGLELASSTSVCRHIIGIFVFASGSVAGIALGAFVSNVHNTVSDILMAVLQGMAGGTLLYVTLSEIVPRERARWHQQHEKRSAGIYQFFSIVLGFIIMTIMTQYLDAD
ncbi:hypothetical protein HHI36_018991 [Cryptolaemus montrouzieri]|uniref:Zinc transporter ZIP3 n=1 Tax=Cryptolaemus montrouzieri TaxID=559131 RepID=A0ABD2P1Q5_9CUCU